MLLRRTVRILLLATPFALGGCSYVHFGKLPGPITELRDEKLLTENSDLRAEKKLLQQELALTKAEGAALRMAIENRTADGDTSKKLTDELADATRDLAKLRADYTKMLAERDQAITALNTSSALVEARGEATELRTRLSATEDKLADSLRTYTQLQEEVGKLRTEIDHTREENTALNEQVKAAIAQGTVDQAAIAQLNTELLAQKDLRERAERDSATLRTQLASNGTALAQLRTGNAGEAKTMGPDSAEIVVLKQQVESYQSRVEALETERTQLRQQVAALEARPALADIEAKLASALADNTSLQTQLSALRSGAAPAADAQGLRDQLRDAQAQVAALTEENARLKTRLATDPHPVRIALSGDNSRPTSESAPAPGDPAPKSGGSTVTATFTTSSGGTMAKTSQTGTVHVVAAGDTLAKIATRYYGAPDRWSEILTANRDVLGENNNLVIGRSLRIP